MKYIKHPFEFFLAQIIFAKKMSTLLDIRFEDSLIEYTDLYVVFTGSNWTEKEDRGEYLDFWKTFIELNSQVNDMYEFAKRMYDEYIKQAYAYVEVEKEDPYLIKDNEYRFGCFTIDFSEYNRSKGQVRLHFTPLRKGLFNDSRFAGEGDLSSNYFSQRKTEFKELVTFIKDNPDKFNDAEFLVSSTWLQNLPNYQKLFPPKYSLDQNREKREDSFLGLWGQFEKWNFEGNVSNLKKFEEKLNKARTKEEAIDSFPNPVYKIRVPLREMFEYYGL